MGRVSSPLLNTKCLRVNELNLIPARVHLRIARVRPLEISRNDSRSELAQRIRFAPSPTDAIALGVK